MDGYVEGCGCACRDSGAQGHVGPAGAEEAPPYYESRGASSLEKRLDECRERLTDTQLYVSALEERILEDRESIRDLNDYAAEAHEANARWWIDPTRIRVRGSGNFGKLTGKFTDGKLASTGAEWVVLDSGSTFPLFPDQYDLEGVNLQRNKGELLMLIVSEIAEAMEGARTDAQDDKLPWRKAEEVELADALIRIFDYAGAFDLDLENAYRQKMRYNADRYDHTHEARRAEGGKRF